MTGTILDPWLDAEYDNRAKVPGHPAVLAAWARDAAAFRDAHAERRCLATLQASWATDGIVKTRALSVAFD